MRRIPGLLEELKRRKVFQVASIYLVTAWGTALGASELLPNFGAPEWVIRVLVITLLLLFPVVVAPAWYYELTREGLVRDPRDQEGGDAMDTSTRRAAATLQTTVAPASAALEICWEERGQRHVRTFATPFTLGRDAECEVAILDPLASRRHARVEPSEAGWRINDINSRNGTLVDGASVTQSLLPLKCIVQLGKGGQVFEIRVLDRAAEAMVGRPGLNDRTGMATEVPRRT